MSNRTTLLAEFRLLYPWMPESLANVWIDAFIEFDDSELAWQEVRNGEGKSVYDQTFPGNRREDGTLRLTEQQYRSNLLQYRRSLVQRGLNPDLFEGQLSNLIEGEVAPDEFEARIAAINESIVQQGDDVIRAFAEASGVADFTPEAALATVLDPEGVGRELLERRISVAQVRGAASESGIFRSQERVEEILRRTDLSLAQAREFFSQAGERTDRLSDMARRFEGPGAGVSVDDLEEAALLREQQQVSRLTRLLAQETSSFTPQGGFGRNRTVEGLRPNQQR